jgi:predicted TPR repeat methyltransferase
MAGNYVESHKKADKGTTYDKHYEEDPWRRFLWHREQLALAKILDDFFKNRQINLLDFACGTGRISGFLENRVSQATGVDVSESMLNEAKQKLTRTELICADITKEDVFKGRKFNLITAFRFFLNAEPPLRKAAMDSLMPLLDEDGFFVFNNHRNSTSPLVRFAFKHRKKRNFMSMSEMSDIAKSAGLEIVKIYPVGFLPIRGFTLPAFVNNAIDNFASKFDNLQNYSESPIVVCKRSAVR